MQKYLHYYFSLPYICIAFSKQHYCIIYELNLLKKSVGDKIKDNAGTFPKLFSYHYNLHSSTTIQFYNEYPAGTCRF